MTQVIGKNEVTNRSLQPNRTQPARSLFKSDDARWVAVTSRDKNADGIFYYSVRTTGIYCRPSCGARLANRENVRFHLSCMEAEQAGFRACKRCQPNSPALADQHAALVTNACRIMETSDTPSKLDELAAASGMSRFHFHRVFKAVTGVTPKAYASAHRNQRMRDQLKQSNTVTGAIYDVGFSSSSRFYESASTSLGMTPTDFRKGGNNVTIRFAVGQCSLGAILVASTEKGICAILIDDDADFLVRDLQDRFPKAQLIGGDSTFEEWVARVVGFVAAPKLGLDLPLDIRGTAFQQRVWRALCDIPAGMTLSYSALAQRIDSPKAVRAVASACAANAIAVAIPCHRVVRTDGALSGYRWGIERKRTLLDREAEE